MPPPTLLIKGSLVSDDPKLANVVPLEYIIDWFKNAMTKPPSIKNRILVLKSDTGSGKSTAFPATLFKVFFKKGGGSIACAQPRVLNAVSIVRDLCSSPHYSFFKLGENIGWQTGPTKRLPAVGLTYMTIGVFTMLMKTLTDDQLMNKYRFIIVDEVHEASLDQARLMYMIRNFMIRNATHNQLPFVVLTSATFDTNKFLRYFDIDDPDRKNLISVSGFTYPLTEQWVIKKPVDDVFAACIREIDRINKEGADDKPTSADILVFLPGMAEIERLYLELVKLNTNTTNKFMPLVVVSETVSENKPDYAAVFAPIETLQVKVGSKYYVPKRRIILSTNVAETGVTIETLRYVIDCGFNRTPEYNPTYNTHALITKCATMSMIRQRMGRANRKAPGVFVPLYPKALFDKFMPNNLAAVETSDTLPILLDLIYEQIKNRYAEGVKRGLEDNRPSIDVNEIRLLDEIPHDSMCRSLQTLYALGFISPYSNYKYKALTNDIVLDRVALIADESLSSLHETKRQTSTSADDVVYARKFNTLNKFNITKLGAFAVAMGLRIAMQSVRMLMSGYLHDVSIVDLISIAAYLQFDNNDFNLSSTEPVKMIEVLKKGLPDYFISPKVQKTQISDGTSNVTSNVASNVIEGSSGGKDTDETNLFKTKILIADDFLTGLWLFRAIGSIVESVSGDLIMESLAAWCANANIKFKTVVMFLQQREEIINSLIVAGFEVFVGESIFTVEEKQFMNMLVKLKYCIYDGYKLNMATWSESHNSYVTRQGLKLKTPALLSTTEQSIAEAKSHGVELGVKPRYILYDTIALKSDRKTQLFVAHVTRISVLDSYVHF